MTHLVAWCREADQTDHWEIFDTLDEAQRRYNELSVALDVYSASIFSNVVASTDYDVTPQLRQSESFNREERYIVIKISKIIAAPFRERVIKDLKREYADALVDCVVVESDWPEYEPTWKAIERRVMSNQSATDELPGLWDKSDLTGGETDCAVKPVTELEKERDGWKWQSELHKSQRDDAREQLNTMILHQRNDVWCWMGDGTDNLHSMSNGMVVVIRADVLRNLIKQPGTYNVRSTAQQVDLDFTNNYLTRAKFAEHQGITEDQATRLIELFREINATPHPES